MQMWSAAGSIEPRLHVRSVASSDEPRMQIFSAACHDVPRMQMGNAACSNELRMHMGSRRTPSVLSEQQVYQGRVRCGATTVSYTPPVLKCGGCVSASLAQMSGGCQ